MADVRTLSLVCEAHPDLPFPHGDCSGPGCPPSHRVAVLTEALRDLRMAAAFGDATAAAWLQARGIDMEGDGRD